MLFDVEDRLRRMGRPDDIVLGTFHAIGILPLVEDKLAAPPAPVALRQETIVPAN